MNPSSSTTISSCSSRRCALGWALIWTCSFRPVVLHLFRIVLFIVDGSFIRITASKVIEISKLHTEARQQRILPESYSRGVRSRYHQYGAFSQIASRELPHSRCHSLLVNRQVLINKSNYLRSCLAGGFREAGQDTVDFYEDIDEATKVWLKVLHNCLKDEEMMLLQGEFGNWVLMQKTAGLFLSFLSKFL